MLLPDAIPASRPRSVVRAPKNALLRGGGQYDLKHTGSPGVKRICGHMRWWAGYRKTIRVEVANEAPEMGEYAGATRKRNKHDE